MKYGLLVLYIVLAGTAIFKARGRAMDPDPWFAARTLPAGHQLLRTDLLPAQKRRSLLRIRADSLVGKHLSGPALAGAPIPLDNIQPRAAHSSPPAGYADLRTLLTAQELEMTRGLTLVGDSLTVCSLVAGKDKPTWLCETCGTVVTLHGGTGDTSTGWLVLRVHVEHLDRVSAVVAGDRRVFARRNVPRPVLDM